MKDEVKALGQRLRKAREDADMTGTAVSRVLGNSKQTISHWENGRVEISVQDLHRVANLYAVSVEWLVTGGKQPPVNAGARLRLDRGRIIPRATSAELLALADDKISFDKINERRQTYAEVSTKALSFAVSDNSMDDGVGHPDGPFREGDIVTVDPERAPKPGQCVLFVNKKTKDILFRRYKASGYRKTITPPFKLTADNASYEAIEVKTMDDVVFFGTIAEHVILSK